MKVDFNLHLVLSLCCLFFGSSAYAYNHKEPGYSPTICHPGYWTPLTCSNDYNVCISSSNAKLTQSNTNLTELKQEQGAIPGKINSCMKALLASVKTEFDRKSDFIQSQTKNDYLKMAKSQVENLKGLQESFFYPLMKTLIHLEMLFHKLLSA